MDRVQQNYETRDYWKRAARARDEADEMLAIRNDFSVVRDDLARERALARKQMLADARRLGESMAVASAHTNQAAYDEFMLELAPIIADAYSRISAGSPSSGL